ncbi:MAG TPA: agmatine deiminase family protein [Pyrinomonadaceae bacterium]|jgi:agmatine deiminase
MPRPKDTPNALGYIMPAEWERHEATWLAWPHKLSDWPGKIAPIPWVYGEIIRKIVRSEVVRLLVNSKSHELKVRRLLTRVGIDLSRIEFLRFPTNRSWMRDLGPLFVKQRRAKTGPAIVDLHFNGWAKYKDWHKDSTIPTKAARALNCRLFDARVEGHPFVLEGGSIDVNGAGTVLSTEECLLDPKIQVRNPSLSQKDIEAGMLNHLGAKNVIWLGKGIAGDDTHGHIDDFCRFVRRQTVVLCRETNSNDSNYNVLEENYERLQTARLEDGSGVEVVNLPMPAPLYLNGQRMPASYANFYICNDLVLVPTFNDPQDRIALGIMAELFPDREVVGIHAVDLVWGLGTIHCLTQQQPATNT